MKKKNVFALMFASAGLKTNQVMTNESCFHITQDHYHSTDLSKGISVTN